MIGDLFSASLSNSRDLSFSLVNLYSFDQPSPQNTLSGHTSFVYSVTALPDGSGAISSGEDGTLRVWSSTPPSAPS